MAASYVMVTAAAVLAVEAVLLGLYVPSLVSGSDLQSRLQDQAGRDAKVLSLTLTKLAALSPGVPVEELLVMAARDSGDAISLSGTPLGDDSGVMISKTGTGRSGRPIEVLADRRGQVIGSSAQDVYATGSVLPVPLSSGGNTGKTPAGKAMWWVSPVLFSSTGMPGGGQAPAKGASTGGKAGKDPSRGEGFTTAAYVFVQAPLGYAAPPGTSSSLYPLLLPGVLALSLVLPVGLLFGMLSTRRLIGRVQRLAAVTGAVSQGDFRPRVPVTPGDEVGRLEESFNAMTERLSGSVAAERLLAEADARQAERARIARELHDSISQDLFSLSLLAAGMRRAAPQTLRPQADSMERTAARAMREMQALLLELRPVALEDAGLVPALHELCRAYESRLGIRVDAVLDEVTLPPAVEHAVLRLVQESIGNAIKHAEPELVEVRLRRTGDAVTVEVRDDGEGFDPASAAAGHGMGLTMMRERVRELGGSLRLSTEPGDGTTVTARLPLPPARWESAPGAGEEPPR